jgi:hypothetical protein
MIKFAASALSVSIIAWPIQHPGLTTDGATAAGISASPTSVAPGGSTTLTWTTKNAVSADLNGTPVPLNGSKVVHPTATTAYRVTAHSSTGATDEGTVNVTVGSVGTVAAGISASPTFVAPGGSTTLTWTTKNAVSADLNGTPVPLNGSKVVHPTATTAYRVTAHSSTGATDAGQITVTVGTVTSGAVAAGISASPTSVAPGGSTTLTWNTVNAVSADLNGTPVPLKGSKVVFPTATTAYRVTAHSSTGATDEGTVNVTVGSVGTVRTVLDPVATGGLRAAVHYVSPAGSDTSNGSATHPWATIQHADREVKPGDTVVVLNGTYSGDILLRSSGTARRPITYVAQNKWGAKLVGTTSGEGTAVIRVTGGHLIIKDFDITGTDASGVLLAASGTSASFNQAIGNYVHDLTTPCDQKGGAGLNSGGGDNYRGISHNDFIGNMVVNIHGIPGCTAGVSPAGIYEAVPYGVVANNIVINAGYAIQCWHNAHHETISGNILANNFRGITVGAGDAPGGILNDYTVVKDNVIVGSVSWAIAESGETGRHNTYTGNMLFNNSSSITLEHGLAATETTYSNGPPPAVIIPER